ncbi:hypothetical protein [Pedobacter nutrimenti]|uniref:Uncharacterized protein n=1 Tax=Pedobacter nutrimenti TaxID=1241337 RepID=A0A318U677_9SPHI|nr:hypothetical protein [Pedobacter nutrimenti]PYF68493.1 hypothetical protein B0O44_11280 [Pedobacter nutrimenti]
MNYKKNFNSLFIKLLLFLFYGVIGLLFLFGDKNYFGNLPTSFYKITGVVFTLASIATILLLIRDLAYNSKPSNKVELFLKYHIPDHFTEEQTNQKLNQIAYGNGPDYNETDRDIALGLIRLKQKLY